MFFVKCDSCGFEEKAREYGNEVKVTTKPMFCEPKEWLRRFDAKTGKVVAILCCLQCDRNYSRGVVRKAGNEPK